MLIVKSYSFMNRRSLDGEIIRSWAVFRLIFLELSLLCFTVSEFSYRHGHAPWSNLISKVG